MRKSNVVVKQPLNKADQIPYEVMAQSIVDISKFAAGVKQSRLNEKAVLVLVQNMTGVSQSTIKQVIDSLVDLERTFLKR